MIQLKNIHSDALHDVSITVPQGVKTVLLGGANSGKSAVCDIACGVTVPDSGEVWIDSESMITDAYEAKRLVGYVPQDPAMFRDMTVRSQLKFIGQVREMGAHAIAERVDALVKQTGLDDVANIAIRSLPAVYLPRVALAIALMQDGGNLVLDCPTANMDTKQVFEFRRILKDACGDLSVLIATDNLNEALFLGDEVYVLEDGRVTGCGTMAHLNDLMLDNDRVRVAVAGEASALEDALKTIGMEYTGCAARDGIARAEVTAGQGWAGCAKLSAALLNAGLPVVELTKLPRSLEEVAAKLTVDAQ